MQNWTLTQVDYEDKRKEYPAPLSLRLMEVDALQRAVALESLSVLRSTRSYRMGLRRRCQKATRESERRGQGVARRRACYDASPTRFLFRPVAISHLI